MEILPHNEQISRILYLCKNEDLKDKSICWCKQKQKKQKKKKRRDWSSLENQSIDLGSWTRCEILEVTSDDQVIYSHIVSRATITSVIYYAYAKVEGRHLLIKGNLEFSKEANRYMYDG